MRPSRAEILLSTGIRRLRRLGFALAFAPSLALAGCSVNDLLLEPSEARDTQAADPVDPSRYGDRPVEITVRNRLQHKLEGWLFAAPGDRGTVLVAGGNGMGIAHTYTYNRFLLGHGFRVLVFSYQGFDGNEGEADIASLPGDAEAFHDAVAQLFPGEPVAFLGESIGAIAGFCAAAEDDFSGLALEGLIDPKSVANTIIETHFSPPLSSLLSFTFGPGAVLYSAAVPSALGAERCSARLRDTNVLFLHQRADPVASFATVEHLARLRPRHSTILELPRSADGAHLSLQHDPAAQARVIDFIAGNLTAPGATAGGALQAAHVSGPAARPAARPE